MILPDHARDGQADQGFQLPNIFQPFADLLAVLFAPALQRVYGMVIPHQKAQADDI